MKESLTVIAENAVLIIHAMALVIIIIGTIEAFLRSLCAVFRPVSAGSHLFVMPICGMRAGSWAA